MMISSELSICIRIESSCSEIKRPPLKVAMQMDIFIPEVSLMLTQPRKAEVRVCVLAASPVCSSNPFFP